MLVNKGLEDPYISMRNPKGKDLVVDEEEEIEPIVEVEPEDANVNNEEEGLDLADLLTAPFSSKVDSYVEHDGVRYHKSNLVNSFLNNMTKLSSDRLIRVQQKTQSMLELANENEGLLLKLTDTIATIAKIMLKIAVVEILNLT